MHERSGVEQNKLASGQWVAGAIGAVVAVALGDVAMADIATDGEVVDAVDVMVIGDIAANGEEVDVVAVVVVMEPAVDAELVIEICPD